jgi:hypothetical protein
VEPSGLAVGCLSDDQTVNLVTCLDLSLRTRKSVLK